MKRILALVLAMSLVLVGCESNPNAIAKFSKENWKEVISENFGINLSDPDGWVIEDVENNRTNKVELNFIVDGNETYHTYGEKMFDEISSKCIGKPVSGFDEISELDTYEDAATFGDVVCLNYEMEGYNVEVYYYNNQGTAELTLNRRTK